MSGVRRLPAARAGSRLAGAAGLLLLLAAAGGCVTDPLARGDARYRAGDLSGAVAAWRAVPPEAPAYDEAQARIRQANAFAARLVAERVALAERYRAEGRFAEAVLVYREALALDPSRSDLAARIERLARRLAREKAAARRRVAAHLAAGDLVAAYDELLVLRILDPSDVDVLEQLEALEPARTVQARRFVEEARGLADRGQFAAARRAATRALEHDPQAPGAAALLADIARREAAAAQRTARKAPAGPSGGRAAPSGGQAARPSPALEGALALEAAGRPLEALRALVEAAGADPGADRVAAELSRLRGALQHRVEELFVQGIRFYRAERMQRAIERWETVLLIDPEHEKARLYVEKARKILEKLAAIRGDEAAERAP